MVYTITGCEAEPDYRYVLFVHTAAPGDKSVVVIQCNPSRASSARSDPTVGKVSNWAEENGFFSVTFLNLFARRSPSVDEISHLPYEELVGPRNNEALLRYAAMSSALVLAWGGTLPVPDSLYLQRLREVRDLLRECPVYRVGELVYGRFPRHGRIWNAGNRTLEPLSWGEVLLNNSLQGRRH